MHRVILLATSLFVLAGARCGDQTASNLQGSHVVVAPTKKALGASCGGAAECLSDFCIDGVCCDTACNGACGACTVPSSVGICTSACGNFACSADSKSCYDTCATSDQCVSGGTCADGICLAPTGQYTLSGGGVIGCSYGGAGGSAGAGASLALLGLLALLARRAAAGPSGRVSVRSGARRAGRLARRAADAAAAR